MFGSHYPGAVDVFFEAARDRGLRAAAGLVVGDRLLRDELHTTPDRAYAEASDLAARWHGEGRTVLAVLHDLDLVRERFPQSLLLAREPVAWGPTKEALAPANLLRARRMGEAFDEAGAVCRRDAA